MSGLDLDLRPPHLLKRFGLWQSRAVQLADLLHGLVSSDPATAPAPGGVLN